MITTSTQVGPSQPGIHRLVGVFVESYDNNRVTEILPSLRSAHPNTLLVGSVGQTERALDDIRPTLRTPVASWSPAKSPKLPAGTYRTLIVNGIERLTPNQQTNLATLLSQADSRIQVVSLARRPLFPLVTRGSFRDDLYYLLNVVLLEFPSDPYMDELACC
jgi:hypothetical protein